MLLWDTKSSAGNIAVGTCVVMCAVFTALSSASADDLSIPGSTVKFKTYIEGEGGYDSNPDGLFAKQGSAFEKVEGGLRATSTTATESYELFLKARDILFNSLDDNNRWDFKGGLDTSFVMGPSQKLSLGSYYLRDFVALDKLEIVHSYGEYAITGDEYRLKFEGISHVEHNLGEDVQGPKEPLGDFNASQGKAFDFSRTDGKISGIAFTKSMLQPFLIMDAADINYFHQVTGALINRDATEEFAVAGIRFDFDKTFRVDLGGRYNRRDFDDKVFTDSDRGFVDVNAYWQPTDAFKATLVVERYFRAPSTSFGLADDVRSLGITADWRFDKQWRMNAAGYYDRIDVIGEDLNYNKYTATLSLTYEPTDSVEIFLSGLGKWVTEEVNDDNYDRYKIGSGVRFKF
jgi:hypothetical protein